ncbi:VOC family protein [Paenibacillus thailandensis]|uniref:VOC family protein n=1 Tax=Paenibacillus thailandensis TaxID=393250 RepID=A0ABW5QXV6_9BACL
MQVNGYILLDGNAAEAIRYYEQTLGAEVLFSQTFGEAPEDVTAEMTDGQKRLVAHAVLKIGESVLFVADASEELTLTEGNRVSICLTTDRAEETRRIYEALLPGSNVPAPLQPLYFSPAYGMLTDRYGVTFQLFTKRQ